MMQAKHELFKQLLSQHLNTSSFIHSMEVAEVDIIKRKLRLIRGLAQYSEVSLDDINQLNAAEAQQLAKDYQALISTNPQFQTKAQAKESASFFYNLTPNYPFVFDIIRAPQEQKSNPLAGPNSGTLSVTAPQASQKVHGYQLKEDEAISSTRYYTEDKQQFGKIIAKNGSFKATQNNLNEDQKSDLALETAFQFLINLEPNKNSVTISGSPTLAHKFNAAFLYYKKELGESFETRFPNFKIILPEGVSMDNAISLEQYIKTHLGTPPAPPRQFEQLQTFLTHEKTQAINEKIKGLIDIDKCTMAPDLTPEDKTKITQYHTILQEYMHTNPQSAVAKEQLFAQQKHFLNMTQEILPYLNKSTHLQQEHKAISLLYDLTMAKNEKLLVDLDNEYQAQIKDLDQQLVTSLQATLKGVIEDFTTCVALTKTFTSPESDEFIECEKQLQQTQQALEGKECLTKDEKQSAVIQMYQALNLLEKHQIQGYFPEFNKLKALFEEKIKSPQIDQPNETLTSKTRLIKEQLNDLKASAVEKMVLNPDDHKELRQLAQRATDIIEQNADLKNNIRIHRFSKQLFNIQNIDKADLSLKQTNEVQKQIETLTTQIKGYPEFIDTLCSMNKILAQTPNNEEQDAKSNLLPM